MLQYFILLCRKNSQKIKFLRECYGSASGGGGKTGNLFNGMSANS
jgi:hypothetical protein